MKFIVSLLCVLCLMLVFACGGQQTETSGEPEASQPAQPTAAAETQPEPEPEVPAAASLGKVKAKPDEDAAEIEFDIKTAALAHARGKFTVCLSDLANDKVMKWGFFPNPQPDDPDHHRIEIYFKEAPTAPGEYEMVRFNYAAKGPDTDIDTGWTGDILSGKVIVENMEGELPEGTGGVEPRPAKMSGSFTVTITGLHPGSFSGTFKAEGFE